MIKHSIKITHIAVKCLSKKSRMTEHFSKMIELS
jgi:hypothetical protein